MIHFPSFLPAVLTHRLHFLPWMRLLSCRRKPGFGHQEGLAVICQGNLLSTQMEIHHQIQAGLRSARRKRPPTRGWGWGGGGDLFDAAASDHISDEWRSLRLCSRGVVTMLALSISMTCIQTVVGVLCVIDHGIIIIIKHFLLHSQANFLLIFAFSNFKEETVSQEAFSL